MKKWGEQIYEKVMTFFARIRFEWLIKLYKKPNYITHEDKMQIMDKLRQGNYMIATMDPYSLSGLFVRFSHWFITGHKANYTHVLLNLEGEGEDFRFVEATSKGVHSSSFHDVFKHVQNVALCRPKYYTGEQFDDCANQADKLIGRRYDFKYKLADTLKMSCVEVLLWCLKQLPFYDDNMRCLKFIMEYERQLTPDMYVECPDIKVELEIRR